MAVSDESYTGRSPPNSPKRIYFQEDLGLILQKEFIFKLK